MAKRRFKFVEMRNTTISGSYDGRTCAMYGLPQIDISRLPCPMTSLRPSMTTNKPRDLECSTGRQKSLPRCWCYRAYRDCVRDGWSRAPIIEMLIPSTHDDSFRGNTQDIRPYLLSRFALSDVIATSDPAPFEPRTPALAIVLWILTTSSSKAGVGHAVGRLHTLSGHRCWNINTLRREPCRSGRTSRPDSGLRIVLGGSAPAIVVTSIATGENELQIRTPDGIVWQMTHHTPKDFPVFQSQDLNFQDWVVRGKLEQ